MIKTRKAAFSLTSIFTSLALMATAATTVAETPAASNPAPVHGIAMHGELKYPENFSHFDYVNPDAPKGGTLRMSVVANGFDSRSEEHTSELQSRPHLVCRLLLEKKKL